MINKTTALTVFIFLFLTMFLGPGAFCLKAEIDIQVVEPEKQEVIPGDTSTISLRLINNTEESLTLQEELALPKGINNITPFSQLTLGPKEKMVVLVNLHISRNTEAGIYSLNYIIKDEEIEAEKEISLNVLARPKMELSLRQIPSNVLDGQDYFVEFVLQNTGNTKLRNKLNVSDNLEYSIDLETEDSILYPGETETVIVAVNTEEDINQRLTHRLRLGVEGITEDGEVITESTSASVKVFPRVTGDPDPYHRLPVTLEANFSHRKDLGVQFELAAKGPVDVEGEEWMDIFIRPPGLEITGDQFPKNSPEYRFSNWYDDRRIDLGDHRFSLSYLTESRFPGRGLSIREEIGNFELGAYYRFNRNFKFEGFGGAVKADYYPDGQELDWLIKDTKLWVGFLNLEKEDEREQMLTLGGEFTAEERHDFELEYAKGLGKFTGQAFSVDADGNHESLNYRASYLRADPDFPGEKTDRESYSVNLGYDFVPEFSLSGSYGHRRDNLDLDPDKEADGRDSISVKGSFSHEDTRFDLSRSQTLRKDRRDNPEFDEKEVAWESVLRQSFADIDLRTSYRRTWFDNLLEGTEKVYDRFRVRVKYTPSSCHSYRADYSLSLNEDETRHWGSLSYDFEVREDIDLSLDYSRWYEEKNNEEEESIRDRFTASVRKVLPEQKVELSFRGRYTRREDKDGEFSVRTEYSQDITFGHPVGKRPVGKLTGRIYDAEDPAQPGLEDVIVRVDGMTAVTDEDGYYSFPDLEPGNYHLQFDRNTLELGHIVDENMPLSFTIEAEEEKEIDLGVLKGASISGQALVYKPRGVNNNLNNNNNLQGETGDNNSIILNQGVEMEPDYGLGGLLLVLRNEENSNTEVEYTDSQGEFSFKGLRPGSWELVLNDNGSLPEHHELEEDTFTFEIEPGEEIDDIEIRVFPKERELEFIDEGEILDLNNNEELETEKEEGTDPQESLECGE